MPQVTKVVATILPSLGVRFEAVYDDGTRVVIRKESNVDYNFARFAGNVWPGSRQSPWKFSAKAVAGALAIEYDQEARAVRLATIEASALAAGRR